VLDPGFVDRDRSAGESSRHVPDRTRVVHVDVGQQDVVEPLDAELAERLEQIARSGRRPHVDEEGRAACAEPDADEVRKPVIGG